MAYIGQGKFATVYKAESADNKIVALKKVKVNNIFVQCILKLVEIYYYLYLKSIFICKG
jgi:serine/threonine protein kinase